MHRQTEGADKLGGKSLAVADLAGDLGGVNRLHPIELAGILLEHNQQ
jgi:hypothetical protein